LVAGAGAGKTTTMAAKVKYLVEKQQVNPKDIVVISYTNRAIDELKDRINKGLNIPVSISTFHSFAFDIVKKTAENTPEVNFQSYKIIHQILSQTIFDNKTLMRNLVMFLGYYFDLPEDAFNFKTLNEYHLFKAAADYETIKSSIGEYIVNVANKRQKQVKTITGEYLRSIQEVQIANFLYLNGIEYEYEKCYEHDIPKFRKKYTPDFYIKQGELTAYIEHFGLNQNMQSNIFSPQQLAAYQKGISDKRRIHKHFNTTLIETWSFYHDRRPLLEHLNEELTAQGFVLNPRPFEEIYRKLVDTSNDKYIVKLIWFMMQFIEQYKTSGFDDTGFEFLRTRTDNVRNLLFLEIAEAVYGFYQKTLKEQNQIDFADMINDANTLLSDMKRQGLTLSYRYVIIDEFQDIARQRFNLTKKLAEISGAKVIAVGDDWQSIYAFAGSDISLFTKFLELMGSGKEMKITHTYRNSQELIDIAGQFVQKNTMQIRKKLISPKSLKEPIKLINYDDSNQSNINLANAVVSAIGQIVLEFGPKQSVLLIGRYGFDLDKLANSKVFSLINQNELKCLKYPGVKLTGMTAHASKGLGYDQVIILNMLESRFGFPSQIEDDPIIKMVTVEDRSIPFAEERRLFYVALTRTKNRVYIMAPLYKPSRFLVELIEDYNLSHSQEMNLSVVNLFKNRCPQCGFPLKYEFNKNYGLPLNICTNEVEICDFMTNNLTFLKDIYKCPGCTDGYMIVKQNHKTKEGFYGCTNFNNDERPCKNAVKFSQSL
jgi:DNA helicase-4